MNNEPLLVEEKNRYVMFPIAKKYEPIFQMYKKASSSYWVAEEISFGEDLKHLDKMSDNEKFFIFHVLAFFAASDGIVSQMIGSCFMEEVKLPEAIAFYAFQNAMEQVHSETYSLMIDTYVKDPTEKDKLFNAVVNFPAIREKAEWCLKWVANDTIPFAQKLISNAITEGLFFSSSFCAIFWLRERGLLPGLSFANQLIARDESLHTEFACLLYTYIVNRIPEVTVHKMMREAVDIEMRFITESIPCAMLGMNEILMKDYIMFMADRLLGMLGYDKIYEKNNPFPFMEYSALENKANFFESRVAAYSKAGVKIDTKIEGVPSVLEINADDDF